MQAYPVAGPAVEPVSLAEAKAHLRLDGSDEDALVLGLVHAARASVEATTRLCLVEQTWRLSGDLWPPGRLIALPVSPVRSVAALRVAPAMGPAVALSPSLARIEAGTDPVRLRIDAAVPEPSIPTGGIEIDLVCGFGSAATDVPEAVRLAIRLLVARWFAARGDEPGSGPGALPPDVAMLLAPFRRPRLRS